jgi:integrase
MPRTPRNLDALRAAYLIVFDSFAAARSDAAGELDISKAAATRLLNRLRDAGLIAAHEVNDEAQGNARKGAFAEVAWQATQTYDSICREQAEAEFDKAFGTGASAATDDAEVTAAPAAFQWPKPLAKVLLDYLKAEVNGDADAPNRAKPFINANRPPLRWTSRTSSRRAWPLAMYSGANGRRRRAPKTLTREQMNRLLAELQPRDRVLFYFLARTGLRIGEALGLKWRDLQSTPGGLVLSIDRQARRRGQDRQRTSQRRRRAKLGARAHPIPRERGVRRTRRPDLRQPHRHPPRRAQRAPTPAPDRQGNRRRMGDAARLPPHTGDRAARRRRTRHDHRPCARARRPELHAPHLQHTEDAPRFDDVDDGFTIELGGLAEASAAGNL